jgi:hypothetical protein
MVNLLDADELAAFRDNSQMMLDMVERVRKHRHAE